ncbi:MAG: fasciclin domain-containing protein [bacterium]
MKNLIALLLVAGFATSCGSTPAMPDADKMQAEAEAKAAEEKAQAEKDAAEQAKEAIKVDVVDTAIAAGEFNTLVQALTAAELVDTLKGEGPFTVFAPTDAAFAKLPPETLAELLKPEGKEKLTAILTYHVVGGKVMAADVAAGDVATVNGANATITVGEDGSVTYAGANVVKTDIDATNGVIHVIDTVVMPPAPAAAPKAKK